jgi:hypothetical protein
VRIDHEALLRGHTVAGERCDVAGVGPLPVAAVRALLLDGDPFVAAILTKGREVRSVAHLGRGLSAHQRTAVEAMGVRCSNIACNATVGIQMDHRVPWVEDPQTALANTDPLCPACHARKTHHGWRLEVGEGPRRFLAPDRAAAASASESLRGRSAHPLGESGDVRPRPVEDRSLRPPAPAMGDPRPPGPSPHGRQLSLC